MRTLALTAVIAIIALALCANQITATGLPPSYAVSWQQYVVDPVVMNAPTYLTQSTSSCLEDSAWIINIGFNFVFYNTTYTSLGYSAVGFIRFGSTVTSYTWQASQQPFPLTTYAILPALVFWGTDMCPGLGVGTSYVSYQTVGTSPNRQLVMRMFNSPMYLANGNNTIDVILTETTNTMEVRYYKVVAPDGNSDETTATIGVQAYSTARSDGFIDYTSFCNAADIKAPGAAQLTGTTVVFSPNLAELFPGAVAALNYTESAATALPPVALTGAYGWSGTPGTSVAMPIGFSFPFYGGYFTTAYISSYGYISFQSATSTLQTGGLPWSSVPYVISFHGQLSDYSYTDSAGQYHSSTERISMHRHKERIPTASPSSARRIVHITCNRRRRRHH